MLGVQVLKICFFQPLNRSMIPVDDEQREISGESMAYSLNTVETGDFVEKE
jgi:hypothetical protein